MTATTLRKRERSPGKSQCHTSGFNGPWWSMQHSEEWRGLNHLSVLGGSASRVSRAHYGIPGFVSPQRGSRPGGDYRLSPILERSSHEITGLETHRAVGMCSPVRARSHSPGASGCGVLPSSPPCSGHVPVQQRLAVQQQYGATDIDQTCHKARGDEAIKQRQRQLNEEIMPPPAAQAPPADSRHVAFIDAIEHKELKKAGLCGHGPLRPNPSAWTLECPTTRPRLSNVDLREVASRWPTAQEREVTRRSLGRRQPGPPRCAEVVQKTAPEPEHQKVHETEAKISKGEKTGAASTAAYPATPEAAEKSAKPERTVNITNKTEKEGAASNAAQPTTPESADKSAKIPEKPDKGEKAAKAETPPKSVKPQRAEKTAKPAVPSSPEKAKTAEKPMKPGAATAASKDKEKEKEKEKDLPRLNLRKVTRMNSDRQLELGSDAIESKASMKSDKNGGVGSCGSSGDLRPGEERSESEKTTERASSTTGSLEDVSAVAAA